MPVREDILCQTCVTRYTPEVQSALCPHYKVRTRQVQGGVTETKVLRRMGARQHPRSGAGRIKEDGSTETDLIEVKDANLTFALKGEDLLQTHIRAVRQGKQGVWVITFANGIEATINLTRRAPR